MENGKPAPIGETRGATGVSRRHALALMLGLPGWLSAAPAAEGSGPPLRLAISESLVTDVNLNDARAAMIVWLNRIMKEMSISASYDPNIFETTQEILSRARRGQADALAINVLEYRQIADLLDPSQIVIGDNGTPEAYVLVVKRDKGIQKLADLRERRLIMQKVPAMCAAPAWLSALLAENHLEQSERFFGKVTTDSKPSRVVLPVFFGQAEAGLISKQGFAIMCELNPQLSRQLTVLATSPIMAASFYLFRKGYRSPQREKLVKVLSSLRANPAGRQLLAMFQYDNLLVKDASCLAETLRVLDLSDRAGGQLGERDRKG